MTTDNTKQNPTSEVEIDNEIDKEVELSEETLEQVNGGRMGPYYGVPRRRLPNKPMPMPMPMDPGEDEDEDDDDVDDIW